MSRSQLVFVAALLAGSAVMLGALGAHGLEDEFVRAESKGWWETAVDYQMWHALALLALAALTPRPGVVVPALFALGVLGFSGSLYALALGGNGSLWGPVTPIGGSLLIVGWLALVVRALRRGFA